MNLEWTYFKELIAAKELSIQYAETTNFYFLRGYDSQVIIAECALNRLFQLDDVSDFETNYKPAANRSLNTEVTTVFEKPNKILQLSTFEATMALNGTFVISQLIPGTANPTGSTSLHGRWVRGGTAWFSPMHVDDRLTGIYVRDDDNISGLGAGTVVGSLTDDALNAANRGWRVPATKGFIDVAAIAGFGFMPAGFYLYVYGVSGSALQVGKKMYLNMDWGKTIG